MDSMLVAKEDDYQRFNQNVIVMRHGERMDNFDPLWVSTAERPWDPPLYEAGKTRSFCKARQLRDSIGFPIHRVFTSPFLRCVQSASEVVYALCAVDDDPSITESAGICVDSSKCKVSIELGLSEMLNSVAVRNPPKDGNYDFKISELEMIFPAGTVDNSAKVYKELPQWGETKIGARERHLQVIQTLADRFPSENLLFITHGEGVRIAVSLFVKDMTMYKYKLDYCAHVHLRRSVFNVNDQNQSFTTENFRQEDQNGITYRPIDTIGNI